MLGSFAPPLFLNPLLIYNNFNAFFTISHHALFWCVFYSPSLSVSNIKATLLMLYLETLLGWPYHLKEYMVWKLSYYMIYLTKIMSSGAFILLLLFLEGCDRGAETWGRNRWSKEARPYVRRVGWWGWCRPYVRGRVEVAGKVKVERVGDELSNW